MKSDERLVALLAILAKQTGEDLDEFRLTFYVERLRPLGEDSVNAALAKMLEGAKRFPTVLEIKQAMGISEPAPQDVARLIADRIYGAVVKYGEVIAPATALGLKEALGPASWDIVQRQGGWNACVDRAGENQVAFMAQVRESAAAYLRTGVIKPDSVVGTTLPPVTMLPTIGKQKMAELGALRQGALALEAAGPIEVTFSLRGGDMVVRAGGRSWSPLGTEEPELTAPVTRRFSNWRDAAEWFATDLHDNPNCEGYLRQLVSAKASLEQPELGDRL